jgi:nucleoside-diphosphate-sugar epimerase
VVNVTGADILSVREIAEWFAERFGKRARFVGTERADALLSNTSRMQETFAAPEVSLDRMCEWVAQWIEEDGPLLGKATKFEARDGSF